MALRTLPLDAVQLARFADRGYVTVPGLFSEAEVGKMDDAVGAWARRQTEAWQPGAGAAADYKAAFLAAWRAAGRPSFRRSPQRNLQHREFFEFCRSPRLLEAVAQILQTTEISMHGIFNARPMMPGAAWTPWHQDGQYSGRHGETDFSVGLTRPVLSVWFPLHDLDAARGGLEVVALEDTGRGLFPDTFVDPDSGLIAIEPEIVAGFDGEVPLIKRGDALLFTQINAHRGTPNRSGDARWSVDVRYEASDGALESGRRFGFVVQSPSGRFEEDTFETWHARCLANLPS